jgi:hypothetical protein
MELSFVARLRGQERIADEKPSNVKSRRTCGVCAKSAGSDFETVAGESPRPVNCSLLPTPARTATAWARWRR